MIIVLKGKLAFISPWRLIYVFNEHSYLILVQNQLITHYNISVYIFNSHLILLQFIISYISLKPSYHIYLIRVKLQHFTSFKITTLLELYLVTTAFQYTYLDTNIIVLYCHFIFLLYPLVHFILYKAPSLI